MYVPCWNCGSDVWHETQLECRHCRAAVRRCADCRNYQESTSTCAALGIEVTPSDAAGPTRLSPSFSCQYYKLRDEVVAARLAARTAQRVRTDARGAVPETAARAAPVTSVPPLPDQPEPTPEAGPVARPRTPLIIAHRGASALAPENTLRAIDLALERGAQAVEIDVHITKDGHPVVIHDGTLQRTTNGSGDVSQMTLSQMEDLDAGAWMAPDFAGERVPTLSEALQAIRPPAWVNIHLRAHENPTDRCERRVAEAITEAGVENRAWVTHHTRHGLYRLRRMLPKLRLCWTTRGGVFDEEYVDDAFYMGFRILQPPYYCVTEGFVQYAHSRGLWVNVSLARTEEEMRHLIGLKVDGVFVDDPDVLRRLLAEKPA